MAGKEAPSERMRSGAQQPVIFRIDLSPRRGGRENSSKIDLMDGKEIGERNLFPAVNLLESKDG
jgi:hypothetical protein